MITVSSREFRAYQKSYIDKVADDDTLMSKEDFLSKVEKVVSEVKEGKTFAMRPNESLDGFLRRMEEEGNDGIVNEKVKVFILSAYGHYDDK